jgi:glucosylceramidase
MAVQTWYERERRSAGVTPDPPDEPPVDPPAGNDEVTVYSWKSGPSNQRFVGQPNFTTSLYNGTLTSRPVRCDSSTASRRQRIEGWGGAITQSTAMVLMGMAPAARTALLRSIFHPTDGDGMNFVRICFGSSDFELDDGSPPRKDANGKIVEAWSSYIYTYDDLPNGQTDMDLSQISFARDMEYIVPILQQIKALNPSVLIKAAPWSAPRWMKTGLPNAYPNNSEGVLQAGMRDVYVSYLVKACAWYETKGLHIDYIAIQNEPTTSNPWATTYYTWQNAIPVYVKLRAALDAAAGQLGGAPAKIQCLDNGINKISWVNSIYGDAAAKAAVDGSAWHTYAANVHTTDLSGLHDNFPGKHMWLTEGTPSQTAEISTELTKMMALFWLGAPQNWCKAVIYWNLVLDQIGGPYYTNGGNGFSQPFVTVWDRAVNGHLKDELKYDPTYAAFQHVAKIKQGAYIGPCDNYPGNPDAYQTRVTTPLDGWDFLFAVNPDGQRVLVCNSNKANTTSPAFKVIDQTTGTNAVNRQFTINPDPNTTTTYVWAGP